MLVSVTTSRRCACWTTPSLMTTLTRSVMVSVAEVKMGGGSFQPIGSTNGKPIRHSWAFYSRQQDSEYWNIGGLDPYTVKNVCDLNLGQIDRSQTGIGSNYCRKDTPECLT
jgi:hypothetical protein